MDILPYLFFRFVSASQPDDTLNPLLSVEKMKHGNEEMRNAAKMRMFGKLTRTCSSWQPNALLCKRFNVPQPSWSVSYLQNVYCITSSQLTVVYFFATSNVQEETKSNLRSSSFSVFDFLKASSHNAPTVPLKESQEDDIAADNPQLQTDNQIIPVNNMSEQTAPSQTSAENESVISEPLKKLTSISDTLARLLADDTVSPDYFCCIFFLQNCHV